MHACKSLYETSGSVDKRQVKIRAGKAKLCRQPACACRVEFTGSVQTYICHSTLHTLPLNAPAIAHNDTLYLWWCVYAELEWIRKRKKCRMAQRWPMFIVYGTPGGARPWKNRSWKTLCFGGEALLRFCNRHHYQGPWSLHREQGGGNKRYVIPHGTQREGKKRERDVGAWQRVCLPFFLFPPSLPTSCSTPLHPVYSWLRPGVSEQSHRVVDILGW